MESVAVPIAIVWADFTDSRENLENVAKAAKAAGASHFCAGILFLQPSAQRVFFPFLAEKFPRHLARYKKSYQAGAYLKGAYSERIREMIQEIREQAGIPPRESSRPFVSPPSKPQLLLLPNAAFSRCALESRYSAEAT